MPFENKEIQLSDFLEGVRKRIKAGGNEDALRFFESFLRNDLVREIEKHPDRIPDWQGEAEASDFDKVYPMAVDLLADAAVRNFREELDTYALADAVSAAFCEEINSTFNLSGDDAFKLTTIGSFTRKAFKASAEGGG